MAIPIRNFGDKPLSLLGFGAMRLPLLADGSVDEAQTFKMLDFAISKGVNYFDTAYPYHGGTSELILGRALSRYPRDSFYLASKFPGHQGDAEHYPAAIFQEQLQKCGVERFDFYLLHNVSEYSIDVYLEPKWGIIDYLLEQKAAGRIGHLGFSSHGSLENLKRFLDATAGRMEFVQIQLNYLDWSLQDAKTKLELIASYGLPVWVMEPVRGGRLAKLDDAAQEKLLALRPKESIASWAFRWLMDIPQIGMILSGMSNLEQMRDNIATFERGEGLSPEEKVLLEEIAQGMYEHIPCTACRYCCSSCPCGLDIPFLLSLADEARFSGNITLNMRAESLPEHKRPSACLACGACSFACPQRIDIPRHLQELAQTLDAGVSWEVLCKQRAEAAAKLKRERGLV